MRQRIFSLETDVFLFRASAFRKHTKFMQMYLDAMCTDLQANIEAVAGPALTVVVLMFLSFCIQVPRKTVDFCCLALG